MKWKWINILLICMKTENYAARRYHQTQYNQSINNYSNENMNLLNESFHITPWGASIFLQICQGSFLGTLDLLLAFDEVALLNLISTDFLGADSDVVRVCELVRLPSESTCPFIQRLGPPVFSADRDSWILKCEWY